MLCSIILSLKTQILTLTKHDGNLSMKIPNLRLQRGQGMTEYIIIVALIAIAAIGSFKYFGQTARSQAAAAAQELAGQDGKAMTTAAGKAATASKKQATDDKGMAKFTSNE